MTQRCKIRRITVTVLGVSVWWNGATVGLAAAQSSTVPEIAVTTAAPRHWRANSALARPVTVQLHQVTLDAALTELGKSANVRIQYRSEAVDAITTPVSLTATRVPLGTVLDHVLAGTSLTPVALRADLVVLQTTGNGMMVSGGILGTVIDARTKQPLRGATILLDDTIRGILTSDDGRFTVVGVSAGTHRMTVRLLGFRKQVSSIRVEEGQNAIVHVALESSANTLDQVVVTGTVIPTELKAVPNAITVITAKELEQRGITHIDQLFRGDVPGLFAQNLGSGVALGEVTMFSRGATALSGASAELSSDPLTGGALLTNPIKTYIDGIELADPKYLSQLDPKSIERIEILTGPQASTIYGSNAINGIMQIFTKRGRTARPQLTLNLQSGWVENNFSSARTPQHDYGAQLNGIEGHLSYNAGGSWRYMGPWTPTNQTTSTSGFGGIRLDLATLVGRVTADMALRRGITQNLQQGDTRQTQVGYRETGWWNSSVTSTNTAGLNAPTTNVLTGQTLGLTLNYAPTGWWSHEFGIGQDASDTDIRRTGRGYTGLADTTLLISASHTDRRSLRYSTTARLPIASLAQATITAGADAWQKLTSAWSVLPQTLTGPLTGSTGVSRQPAHNAGGFLQSQLGIQDHLFLTYGLRIEWNPGYGEQARVIPGRYGVAYTQEIGLVTAKLRGSYGRSTRPPLPTLKTAQAAVDFYSAFSYSFIAPYYAPFDHNLANPDLLPEYQQGGEGGVELYLGTHASLVVTRYNQTVEGLIDRPKVDSVRSNTACLPACSSDVSDPNGYGYFYQYQYLNIGSIRNQGWELHGSVNTGPLTTHGTYSWTKSRVIGITPRYRAYFTQGSYPQYQPGATFRYLPEHTWAFGITYSKSSSSVGLNLTGSGRATIFQDDFYFRSLHSSIRLPQNRLSVTNPLYVNFNSGYTLADLTASHRVTPHIEGILQVQNLTDRYTNDYYSAYATIGRQTKLGFRIQ